MKFLYEPHLIMVDGWRKISLFLDGKYRNIPTDRMISDLLIPPAPVSGWYTLQPDAFDDIPTEDIGLTNELREVLSDAFSLPNVSWGDIKGIMLQRKYRTQITGNLSTLYKEIALRSCRVPQTDDIDSVKALQEFSNLVVKDLAVVAGETKATEKKLFERHFTPSHYICFLYLTLVECYCLKILPCPMNKIFNQHQSYGLFDALNGVMFIGSLPQGSPARNVEESYVACYSRFADWRQVGPIVRGLNMDVLRNPEFVKDFEKSQNGKLYSAIGENIKAQRGDRSGIYPKMLYQCLFCYRFYLQERKRSGSTSPRCYRVDCKRRSEALRSHLSGIGLSKSLL